MTRIIKSRSGSVTSLAQFYAGSGYVPGQNMESTPVPVPWQVPRAVPGLPEDQATGTFSPMNPIAPVFDPSIGNRAFDYPIGINTSVEPRQIDRLSFAKLKALSVNSEIVRLAIETRKDQLARCETNVVPRDPKVKTDPNDPRILRVEQLLRYPDQEHDWTTWLSMLIDQLLVFDTPCLFPAINKAGQLYALDVVDGTTIKRVIDLWGRTPDPGSDPDKPIPAYQQIIKGVPVANFSRRELIYRPRNVRVDHLYGFSPVEQVYLTASMFFNRQLLQHDYFSEGTVPAALMEAPAGWTPEQISSFQRQWDAMMTDNLANKRKIRMVPSGAKITQLKESVLQDPFDEWLTKVILYCFSLPPTALTKSVNRAVADNQSEQAQDEGLEVIKLWVKRLIDYIIEEYFGYTDLVFQWQTDTSVDELKQAQVDQIYLNTGTVSIDEIRSRMGLDPLGIGNAIISPTGTVTLISDIIAGNQASPGASPEDEPPEDEPPEDDKPKGKPDEALEGTGSGGDRGDVTRTVDPSTIKKRELKKKTRLTQIDRDRSLIVEARTNLKNSALKALQRVRADIRVQVPSLFRRVNRNSTLNKAGRASEINSQIDLSGFSLLANPSKDLLEEVFRDGVSEASTQIGFNAIAGNNQAESPDDFITVMNQKAIDYASSRSAELITEISDTTRDDLNALIGKALSDNWSTDELSEQIENYSGFDSYRAEMIARTEIARADVQGNLTLYRDSGMVSEKSWIVSNGGDSDCCDECTANEQQGAIPLDDDFDSGDDAPPAHPNCRCDIIPVVNYADQDEEDPDD